MEIRNYVTATCRDPYQQWIDGLKDLKGRVIIQRRIDRLANGNFGDHRFVGMECGSCESTTIPVIGCITRGRERRWNFCCVADQTDRKKRPAAAAGS